MKAWTSVAAAICAAGMLFVSSANPAFAGINGTIPSEPPPADAPQIPNSLNGNLYWGSIATSGQAEWVKITADSTGRMFVSLEPTQYGPNKDYDLDVYAADAETLLARSTMTAKPDIPMGERLVLNAQPGEVFWARIYGKTANDFYEDPNGNPGYFLAVSYGNFNRLLTAGRPVTALGPAAAGAPAGVFTVTVPFTNNSSSELRDFTAEINVLSGGNTLLNSDGAPTGAGSVMRSIPNIDLPNYAYTTTEDLPGLRPGESFTATFQIGLQTRNQFSLWVDVYGTRFEGNTAVNPAAHEETGLGPSFQFSFRPDAQPNGASQSSYLYLPLLSH